MSPVAFIKWAYALLPKVATTGDYSDLTGKPKNGRVYVATTEKTNCFRIIKSATVSSGTAVFHLTANGNSGGTALFGETFYDSVVVMVSDATAAYQMSWAFSNADKTLTVTVNKYVPGAGGQVSANGAVVKLLIDGK